MNDYHPTKQTAINRFRLGSVTEGVHILILVPRVNTRMPRRIVEFDQVINAQQEESFGSDGANQGTTARSPRVDEADEPLWKDLVYFRGVGLAQGLAWIMWAIGGIAMSNLFYGAALQHLAHEQARCIDEEGEIVEDCENRVYGMKPSNIVANIAVISGLGSSIFLPVIGAMVDFTSYRRLLFRTVLCLIMTIQFIQVFTNGNNWFAFALLQSLAGILARFQFTCIYAYNIDLRELVTGRLFSRGTY